MTEQYKPLPIDPRTVRYSTILRRWPGGVYAMGRNEFEGKVFTHVRNKTTLDEAISAIESDVESPIRKGISVPGVGIDIDATIDTVQLRFDNRSVGLWHEVEDPEIINYMMEAENG